MTEHDIIAKLFPPASKERVEKAKGLAQRQRIDWQRVLDAMSDYQRQQVNDAS